MTTARYMTKDELNEVSDLLFGLTEAMSNVDSSVVAVDFGKVRVVDPNGEDLGAVKYNDDDGWVFVPASMVGEL